MNIRSLDTRAWNLVSARVLQVGVGAVLLFRGLTEVRFASFLYEIDPSASWVQGVLTQASLLGWLLAGVGLIAGVRTRVSTLIALASMLNLETRTVISDGGDNVMRLVLLYMLLLLEPSQRDTQNRTRLFLHNLGVMAIIAQTVLLYMVSGTAKLRGDVWVNGTALYYIMHIDSFSAPWLRPLFTNPVIVTVATYATIAYQVGFPFMLTNRFHILWVAVGIGFHLGILVAMGLTTFSIVMISLGLFTVRDAEWRAIVVTARAWWQRLSRRRTDIPATQPALEVTGDARA